MISEKNIPQLIRNGGSFYTGDKTGIGTLPNDTKELASMLYTPSPSVLDTRKGNHWLVFTREGKKFPYFVGKGNFPDGFCAVYEIKNQPRTMFSGGSFKSEDIAYFVKSIDNEVLEQKLFHNLLPRKLTADDGSQYGFRHGVSLGFGVSLAGLYFVSSYNVHDVIPPSFTKFGSLIFGLAWLQAPIQMLSCDSLGKKADDMRQVNLPMKFEDFVFGKELYNALQKEKARVEHEKEKSDQYRTLRRAGVGISKINLDSFYDAKKQGKQVTIDNYLETPHLPEDVEKAAKILKFERKAA